MFGAVTLYLVCVICRAVALCLYTKGKVPVQSKIITNEFVVLCLVYVDLSCTRLLFSACGCPGAQVKLSSVFFC